MTLTRRALGALAGAALLAASFGTQAQPAAYPDKPVRIIIPYVPGGGADGAARLVAAELSKALGQTFIVESRPGGNTMIATQAVARSPADGYTLLLTGGSTMSVLPLIGDKLAVDPVKELTPISMVSRFPYLIASSSHLGASNLADALAKARAKPGELAYASNGNGGMVHLGMELLSHEAQIKLIHVPYKGFAPAVTDVVAGRTPLMMADWGPIAGSVQSGAIKLLAVTSARRFPLMPDVPTVAEQGFPQYDLEIWFGLYAPAATPPAVIARLGEAMGSGLQRAEVREAFARLGHEAAPSTAAVVRSRIEAEQASFGAIIKRANIKSD